MASTSEELVDRVSISGAVLASLMEDLASGQGDSDGLLFGSVVRRTVTVLQDHGEEEQSVREETTACVTGYCGEDRLMSFYDAAGAVDLDKMERIAEGRAGQGDPVIGWFVQRRNTPLRPSMREGAVSASLRSTPSTSRILPPGFPCFFLLCSASTDRTSATHSYDYRVFQYRRGSMGGFFQPRSVNIVNIGPEFRGHYDSFSPMAPFPHLPLGPEFSEAAKAGRSGSVTALAAGLATGLGLSGASQEKDETRKDDEAGKALDRLAEGFSLDDLGALMGSDGSRQVAQLEALYLNMLSKLEGLAEEVCETSAAVQKQAWINQRRRQGLL